MGRSKEAQALNLYGRVWGLTGGIASGKSSAAGFFAELGIPVLDADAVSRNLSAPSGAAHAAIVQRFGTADREKLREIVFEDARARADLEKILHPLIVSESELEMQRLLRESKSPIVIYEATLLVETGRYKSFAGLIVIESPHDLRRNRLTSRSGLTEEMADKILASQTSDETRRAAATRVLENTGTLGALREKVRSLCTKHGWTGAPATP